MPLKEISLEKLAPVLPTVDEATSVEEFETAATQAFSVCEAFDLETQIWRGRVICQLRALHLLKECPQRTDRWLRNQGISLKQAQSWENIAKSASELVEQGHLSDKGIKNISAKAFQKVIVESPQVAVTVADVAERGTKVDLPYARELIDHQSVKSSDITENLKECLDTGTIKAATAASLVRNIKELEQQENPEISRNTQKIRQSLDEDVSHENVEEQARSAKMLRRFEETAPYCQTLSSGAIEVDRLLSEGVAIESLDLLSGATFYLNKVETLATNLFFMLQKLKKAQDRLYVETGAAHATTRAFCELLQVSKSTDKQLTLLLDNNQQQVTITVQHEIFHEAK